MELLYSDRKLFLEAMRATHAIAGNLSALVFLFWRYVNYQRLLQGQLLSKKLRIPMLEIFYRCWVVSSTDQHAAFSHMYLCDKDQWPPWNELLHKVDPEDSRELVRAFTGHFVAANEFTFSDPITVSVLDIPNALYFLGYRIVPESEDLVGAFVETMIRRLWCAIADREESNELLIDSISTSLVWLRTILQQFHNTWETNTMPLSNIVLAMVNSELLPLVGRAMLLLEPFQSLDRQTPDLVKRSKIMAASRLLFEGISQVVPRDFLEMAFLHTLPVYWQVSRQMEFMSLVVFPEDIYPRRVKEAFVPTHDARALGFRKERRMRVRVAREYIIVRLDVKQSRLGPIVLCSQYPILKRQCPSHEISTPYDPVFIVMYSGNTPATGIIPP
ncbi:unnamed protein product [Rhizoctonia solani]|uniref:Uncharacterized protein n=1 Tax=Rhizoctonia solani TaxID=456999 RepID=A0A8H3GL77_9AGAM|nr:unnamed protein product [Rhizoctonia solani]